MNAQAAPGTPRTMMLGIAVLSVITVGAGLVLTSVWQAQLEDLEPRYFSTRAVGWGQYFRGELGRLLQTMQQEPDGRDWKQRFPEEFVRTLDADLTRIPNLKPVELSLFEPLPRGGGWKRVATFGRTVDAEPRDLDWEHRQEAGLDLAVVRGDPLTSVFVEGPVEDAAGNAEFRFRCVVQFDTLRVLTSRARRAALLLILAFAAVLYVNFLVVFFLGRRQVALHFRSKEKEIRLQAMGSVAEGIAHEVRNPLNAISLMVQYLEKVPGSGQQPTSQDYQRVYMEVGKIRKVIDNFVGFVKLREIELSEWTVEEVVREALEHAAPRLEEVGVAADLTVSGASTIRGDRPKLTQVFRSVVRNAIDAMEGAETRDLTIRIRGDARGVEVGFRDTGPGLTEAALEKMFDPFFSTRSNAMGLGMTLAKTVVESHGGSIEASAAQGGGCVVTVFLPVRF